MSIGVGLVQELCSVLDRIDNHFVEMSQEISKLDLMRTDIHHKLENYTFSVTEGYRMSQALKIIHEERRKVKNEFEVLQRLRAQTQVLTPEVDKIKDKLVKHDEFLKTGGASTYVPRILSNEEDTLDQVCAILKTPGM